MANPIRTGTSRGFVLLQIDNFEALLSEVERLVSVKTFSSWFQVDLNPFKQALVNTVCKWGDMFKQHLINNVTQR